VRALATWHPKFGGVCGLTGFNGGAVEAPLSTEAVDLLIKNHPPATQIHVWVCIAVWPGKSIAVPLAAETYLNETGSKPTAAWYLERNNTLIELMAQLRCPVLGVSNDCEAASFSALQQVVYSRDGHTFFRA